MTGIEKSSVDEAALHDNTATATADVPTVELVENFYINNRGKNNVKIQVKLNDDGIYLRRETEQVNHINEQLIRIEDIVGSRCGPRLKKRANGRLSGCRRGNGGTGGGGGSTGNDHDAASVHSEQQKDISAYLYIYAYLKQEKPVRRCRTVRILRFRSMEKFEDNLRSAQKWHSAIKKLKNRQNAGSQETGHDQNNDDDEEDGEETPKELLILLNPKSGSGKGREMFHKQVAPILKEAELAYDLQITTHANFARELMRTRTDLLQRYRGVVVASGDGLFHEVLNGLMERADWRVLCRHLTLGIIPCGSGNGLAKSIAHMYNEPYEPKPIMNATLSCVSRQCAAMDVLRVELASRATGKVQHMYSFLSVGWGLIADVDIESEKLRSIGASRFTLWTIHRVINLRTYKGRLSYLPWQKKKVETPGGGEGANRQPSMRRRRSATRNSEFFDLPSIGGDEDADADNEEVMDGFADVISLDRSTTHGGDSWHSAFSRRTAYYSIGGHSSRSRRSMTTSVMSKIEAANAQWDMQAPISSLPPVTSPLPLESGGWHSEDGDYIMVHAANTSHLAADCHFVPDSQLNDGIIYLVVIRVGVSRHQLVQFMLAMSSGSHLPEEPNPYIEVIPVSAFRIEPASPADGIMNVDGELVDYGPIQAEILGGLINVMVPNVGKN